MVAAHASEAASLAVGDKLAIAAAAALIIENARVDCAALSHSPQAAMILSDVAVSPAASLGGIERAPSPQ